ncbi:MAG: SMC-Scp complex subunit ScpB [Clostridia bacterium]|nr:SMC-Scp complex subunit ScpB [Clostridia bacterium]
MSNLTNEAALEAMLFASGESVPVKRLAEVMEISESKVVKMLEDLKKKYDEDSKCGIRLVRLEDSYQLSSKKEYYEKIRDLTERKRRASLSNAGLEVLSIVAYNQPITRSTIEFIRGVNSDGALNNLVAAGLVEEVGRLDAPGRPMLFGTSEEFLRCFDLSSLSELPDIDLEYNFGELNHEIIEGEQMEFVKEEAQTTNDNADSLIGDINEIPNE